MIDLTVIGQAVQHGLITLADPTPIDPNTIVDKAKVTVTQISGSILLIMVAVFAIVAFSKRSAMALLMLVVLALVAAIMIVKPDFILGLALGILARLGI